MGYGSTNSWVGKQDAALPDILHQDHGSGLFSEIQELKKENQKLKDKVAELEAENKDLRSYIDALKS